MYIPKKYEENEWEYQQHIIENYPLGTVITSTDDGIIANHIPFFLTQDDNGNKVLRAHLAKVNHQIPSLKDNDNILVIFQSDSSYISPTYYETKTKTQKVVPTWDFASIHCYGKSTIIDDGEFVLQQLKDFSNHQEKSRTQPWEITDAPESYTNLLRKAITGLEVKIERIEGKYKFEQKMPEGDINGVVEGLKEDGVHQVSKLVQETNSRS